jgi:tyrosine-protein kinase Etk/Wzc
MLNQNDTNSKAFNPKEFILTVFSYRYIYIASFIVCFAIAFLVNKFSTTIYEVNSIIGPVEEKPSLLGGANNPFGGLESLSGDKNLENDIVSLNSFSLVASTISELNLEVGYFREKSKISGRTEQISPDSPFKVSIDKSHVQPINAKFYIDIINDNSFRLTCTEDEVMLYNYVDNVVVSDENSIKINSIYKFNETISNDKFKFAISLNKEQYVTDSKENNLFYFEFYHLDMLTQSYVKRLTVEPVNLQSSLINVRFEGENINLTIDFLNRYLQKYLNDNLEKKNKVALNTIKFIDSQISEISDSLISSESKLKDYRSANQVTDLSFQGQKALEQMNQIETEKSSLLVQERYYNYVLDYFSKNKDMAGIAPPSAANVVDPIMNQLIMELLALNSQRSSILSNNAEKNLFLGQIENKIKLQKQAIIENVTNNLNTLNLTQNELNYRAEKLSKEISKLPRTELNMVSMQRKFTLSDAIYTFLLQKRSESAITMASNYPDYEILEPARFISKTILAPKTSKNLLLAFFLTLLFPTVFIILKDFFNEKVNSIFDIQSLINRPVLGIIYSNMHKTEAVVSESPGSSVAESFRNLRSNLFLKMRSDKSKVVLITSAQPQDGKSFISFNLASSIASVGYKTIILDCDLRRPTLHNKFKMDNDLGLSNYMINDASWEKIISKTFVDNLSFIPAGPLLPNPSELMESGKLDDLIQILQGKYEYVILDTTPTGIVADATLMMKYASQILLVCRNNYTRKDVFSDVINMFALNKIENFDVVFNDLNLKKSRYGRYDNYYKK